MLAAAKEVFEEQGAGAALDEIARRAGVGNATMYRHFPTRRELIVAVYADEVATLCDEGEALLADDASGDALFRWLESFVTHVATKRDLALTLPDDASHGDDRSVLFSQWHQAMHATAADLLSQAQQAGAARPDLDPSDLLAVTNGIALGGADPDRAKRLLHLIRHGVAP